MCLDQSYDYDEVRAIVQEFAFTAHIRRRGRDIDHQSRGEHRTRRWVVERSHSWMNHCRRILVQWDKKAKHYLAFLYFTCALIVFPAAGLFG